MLLCQAGQDAQKNMSNMETDLIMLKLCFCILTGMRKNVKIKNDISTLTLLFVTMVCRLVSCNTGRSRYTSGLSGTIRQHRTWLKPPRTSVVRRDGRPALRTPSKWPGKRTQCSFKTNVAQPTLSLFLTPLWKVSLYVHSALSLIPTTSKDNVKCAA